MCEGACVCLCVHACGPQGPFLAPGFLALALCISGISDGIHTCKCVSVGPITLSCLQPEEAPPKGVQVPQTFRPNPAFPPEIAHFSFSRLGYKNEPTAM